MTANLPVPLRFRRAGSSTALLTNAPTVLVKRALQPSVDDAVSVVLQALAARGVHAERHGDDVEFDTRDYAASVNLDRVIELLREASASLRAKRPEVRLDSVTSWAIAERNCGTDNLVWACLGAARTREPIEIHRPATVLASRTLSNPLSALRYSHARAALADDGHHPSGLRSEVNTVLWLAQQAADDAVRTKRPRTWLMYLDELAQTVVVHRERVPVERTDLPSVQLARKVMHDSMRAAGVAAPVPY